MAKNKNDLVRLVNISKDGENERQEKYSKQDITFAYDSVFYTVPEGGNIVIRRELAEHGVKKAHSYANAMHNLKIEELPESQRNSQIIAVPVVDEELKKEAKRLENENAALREQLARQSTLKKEEPIAELKRPGRPKSK